MKYNIYFELAAAALLVVLNLYVYLQYPSDSPSNRHFKRLAGVLFLAVTLDVVKLCRQRSDMAQHRAQYYLPDLRRVP